MAAVRVVMVSCVAYRDAWTAFDVLFRKFWPNQEYAIIDDSARPGTSWCRVVANFAAKQREPFVLLQEDFLLNAPVQVAVIEHAAELLETHKHIGAIRLYPCPGANGISTDPYFAPMTQHAPYRISCQATIWRPGFLYCIANQFETPGQFEVEGTMLAAGLPAEVWAYKRDVEPWPLQYLCSAITRGKWTRDAVHLASSVGVTLDLAVRDIG